MRLLLIEDDKKVAAFIVRGLTESGYTIDVRHDGHSGLEAAGAESYDLIILDWMLPGLDGIKVCKKIREFSKDIPILFLTAKETTQDKITGLDAGADDYLSKPFSFMELLARIRALLRRGSRSADKLTAGDLEINVTERKVMRGGKPIELSNKEFLILEYLVRNKNRLINRATLTEHVWNIDFDRGTNLIDVYINYIRKKLDVGDSKPLIHTVRGAGYVLKEENK
ncbi:response regulator transcription factor [bacterium]|nr:response regulator transcription factor [bacterium]